MEGSSRASMAPSGVAAGDEGGAFPASAEFPAGLRVLVVDDDPICLKILERMLCNCLYDVTTCSRAEDALSMLRERKRGFDLVLSDVYMPDMDGLKLLELIGLEMDLPVIMMSSDGGQDVVMKGVKHGACDYLIKPVRMEALKNIWQHVIRKKRNEQSGVEDGDKQKRSLDDSDNASSANEGNCKNSKRRKDGKEEEDEIEEHEDSSSQKKPRVVWSVELHQEFVAAVKQLGVEKAVPKKILELMNVPGLTRENVASHLQKYRMYLRRLSGRQHQGRFDAPFTGATDSEFGSSSSLDGFDLQALGVSGHLPAQNLMTMHAGPRRVANTNTGMLAVDQIGFYNSDPQIANSSRVRYSSGQILDNKQMDLLWGPSINMEASQPGQSQQSLQAYGNTGLQVSNGTAGFPNLPSSLTSSSFLGGLTNGQGSNSYVMQMTQQGRHFSLSPSQLRGHSLNGFGGEHHSTLPSTIGQQILPHEISGHVSGRGGAILNRNALLAGTFVNTPSYGAVPRPQYDEFQNSCMTQPAGTCYPLVSSIGASGRTSTSMFQEALPALSNTAILKGVNDFIPNYDLFSELRPSKSQDWKPPSKSQDWKLHNINRSCMSTQHLGPKQNNNDLGSSISTRQDFNATIKDSSSRNTCTSRKEIISLRAEIEQKIGCISQHNSTVQVENCVRVKDESLPNPNFQDVLADNIIPNELMSVFGRHQQEGLGQDEFELNFDGCPQDDIPA